MNSFGAVGCSTALGIHAFAFRWVHMLQEREIAAREIAVSCGEEEQARSLPGERRGKAHTGFALWGLGQSPQVCTGECSLHNETAPLGLLCAYESGTLFQLVIIFNHWSFCPS